jgi:uncharacterized protein (DUF433 family)/DNA-directed RNA polymerase subunit RPC12/RpoP
MQVWLKGYQCLRCGHQWLPRKKGVPLKCPSCDSPYWQKPSRKARAAHLEPANEEEESALLELVEIPTELGKRHEPMIKGKGTPVWALVSYYIEAHMTPEEISQIWEGYITPEDVRAAIAYWRKYPELVDLKLGDVE